MEPVVRRCGKRFRKLKIIDREAEKPIVPRIFKKDRPELLVITWDYEDEREVKWFGRKSRVKFVPMWRWLFITLDNNV